MCLCRPIALDVEGKIGFNLTYILSAPSLDMFLSSRDQLSPSDVRTCFELGIGWILGGFTLNPYTMPGGVSHVG